MSSDLSAVPPGCYTTLSITADLPRGYRITSCLGFKKISALEPPEDTAWATVVQLKIIHSAAEAEYKRSYDKHTTEEAVRQQDLMCVQLAHRAGAVTVSNITSH
jgi:hypothetical protein